VEISHKTNRWSALRRVCGQLIDLHVPCQSTAAEIHRKRKIILQHLQTISTFPFNTRNFSTGKLPADHDQEIGNHTIAAVDNVKPNESSNGDSRSLSESHRSTWRHIPQGQFELKPRIKYLYIYIYIYIYIPVAWVPVSPKRRMLSYCGSEVFPGLLYTVRKFLVPFVILRADVPGNSQPRGDRWSARPLEQSKTNGHMCCVARSSDCEMQQG
jgi:hypothetical protein